MAGCRSRRRPQSAPRGRPAAPLALVSARALEVADDLVALGHQSTIFIVKSFFRVQDGLLAGTTAIVEDNLTRMKQLGFEL